MIEIGFKRSELISLHRFSMFLSVTALTATCFAAPDIRSVKNEFSDNPFIAVGVSPVTREVTGYFSALLTAPGKTDECKFLFRGTLGQNGKVRLSIKDAVEGNQSSPPQGGREFASLTAMKHAVTIDLPRTLAPGDCDWVLESVGGPSIISKPAGFTMSVDVGPTGDWIGIAAIRSKRAYFHRAPDATTVRKSFMVAGDVAYVTEEKFGWYHVKFTHALKPTTGWIKASDTVQF